MKFVERLNQFLRDTLYEIPPETLPKHAPRKLGINLFLLMTRFSKNIVSIVEFFLNE